MALSDDLAPALEISSTILGAGAKLARGTAAVRIGERRRDVNEFEATQLEQAAEEFRGASMRKASDETLRANYANSLALARAAASGAGASDPTVMAVLARTAGEGAYRSSLAMYEGEAQARLDRVRANALRYEGVTSMSDAKFAQNQANMGAVSTVLSGGAKALSMFDKYWSGPKTAQAPGGGGGDTAVALAEPSMRILDAGTQLPEGFA